MAIIEGIKQAWLMWVGEKFYGTFEDFAKEAVEQGISKRVPNAGFAKALMEEGNVVFLAHHDGEKDECPDCAGRFECPDCAGEGTYLRGHGSKRKATTCERCDGEGEVTEGTGGSVIVDGEQWPFKRYVGAKRHGFKDADHEVTLPIQCDVCSGKGRTTRAKLMGVFIPSGVEYILKGSETEDELAKLKEKVPGVRFVEASELGTELPRGCGRRKPGGVYVMSADASEAAPTVAELVARGLIEPEAVEVKGGFVRFLNPVDIAQKQFRGIKKITVPAGAMRETEHIMEALA